MPVFDMDDARRKRIKTSTDESNINGYDGGNGGGDDMLERIKKLEDQVSSLVTDVAIIRSNYATSTNVESVKTDIANAKADLHSAMRIQALTIIGSVLTAVGVGVGIIIKLMPSAIH